MATFNDIVTQADAVGYDLLRGIASYIGLDSTLDRNNLDERDRQRLDTIKQDITQMQSTRKITIEKIENLIQKIESMGIAVPGNLTKSLADYKKRLEAKREDMIRRDALQQEIEEQAINKVDKTNVTGGAIRLAHSVNPDTGKSKAQEEFEQERSKIYGLQNQFQKQFKEERL